MTSFKYFATFCGLLIAVSASARGADDNADTGAAPAATAPGDSSTTPKTVHHHKHHAKGSATTPTTNAPVATTEPAAPAPSHGERSSPSGSASSKGGSASGSRGETESPPAAASTTPAGPASSAETAATTGDTPHAHHHHGTDATVTGTTSTTTVSASATSSATVAPAGSPATALAGNKAASSTTGKGRHHRHGKTATAAAPGGPLPEPPIVVPRMTAAVPPPATTGVTLPTPPPLGDSRTAASTIPTVQTGLPVPRPGAGTTATLPIAPIRAPGSAPALLNFSFHDFPAQRAHTRTYPWKVGIVTTVFWIGEGSTPWSGATNKVSAWDMNWVHNNGGADDENDMSGYASAGHASMLNPFYVALPFNDLAYPEKTNRWLPDGWYKGSRRGGKPISACQGRWIEIKNRAGRFCFAQWEDVGPVVTDDAEYVFGSARPSAIQGRGLDVSLAVAKYLGIDSTAITSWRFVDDSDVLPGMWLRYDEQALLFRAIKENLHGSPTPRIQDMEEPVPDPDDSGQKKAGAARG